MTAVISMNPAERPHTVVAFITFAVVPLLAGPSTLSVATVVACALALIAFKGRYPFSFATAVVAAVWGCAFIAGVHFPQLGLALGLAVLLILSRKLEWLKVVFAWLRFGRCDLRTLAWGGGAVVVASVGLVAWHVVLDPDHDAIYTRFGFLELPLPLLMAGALAFALLNAAIEEGVYRGLVMQALEPAIGFKGALSLQAAAFGVLHLWGLPGGWTGVVLATGYGAIMGAIRARAEGIFVAWAAHVATDLVIFTILLVVLRR